jgi:hypothetical protein
MKHCHIEIKKLQARIAALRVKARDAQKQHEFLLIIEANRKKANGGM